MSTQKRSVLKNWFRKGLTPTQAQFADAFDSFFHKNEDLIPLNNIEGLTAALENKKTELQDYLNTELTHAIEELDSRVNDNSDETVSEITFDNEGGDLWMELTMLSGKKERVPLSIPLATTESKGLMSPDDKQNLDEVVARFVDLAEYMEEDKKLPANGVYQWEGIPVESRFYVVSGPPTHISTYYRVFCLDRGETISIGRIVRKTVGFKVRDCLVFSTEDIAEGMSFQGRYQGGSVPAFVQDAFGYTLASTYNNGLMSAQDKENLEILMSRPQPVIMIDIWTDKEPDVIAGETSLVTGCYLYNYATKNCMY